MKNKTLIDSLVGLILGMAIMLGAYYLIPKESINRLFPNTAVETAVFLSSIILCPFFAIFIHELGHLTAGLVQGFKLQLFIVAFLGIKRDEDTVKFYFNKEFQFFGGIAATSPKKITPYLKKQYAYILIAGPLFSLFFGILFIILFNITDSIFNSSIGITGIICIGMFLATTLPSKSGIFFTDRKRMQRLLNKGKIGEIEYVFLKTTSQLLIDAHYKNVSLKDLKMIQSDDEPIIQFWGHYYEFMHYEEMGEEETALKIKNTLYLYKDCIPKTIWKSLSIN
ncbi:M50 family metallopeptidase [Flavobacterium ammonificans]|uniref:Peptidase M50 domain-containing protein n=1 Tax=Flavobacterium ammonificans TaxID=1751056 RepID=A0ABN6KT56_9FLAO|nr:M50 family metallopeptidase [Flavobacterium ammonificans]BDB52305.1 hypothetical protein GENT11_06170 [Flavobacterium ammonificans]